MLRDAPGPRGTPRTTPCSRCTRARGGCDPAVKELLTRTRPRRARRPRRRQPAAPPRRPLARRATRCARCCARTPTARLRPRRACCRSTRCARRGLRVDREHARATDPRRAEERRGEPIRLAPSSRFVVRRRASSNSARTAISSAYALTASSLRTAWGTPAQRCVLAAVVAAACTSAGGRSADVGPVPAHAGAAGDSDDSDDDGGAEQISAGRRVRDRRIAERKPRRGGARARPAPPRATSVARR